MPPGSKRGQSATKLWSQRLERSKKFCQNLLLEPECLWRLGCFLILAELVISVVILKMVRYTEIDWKAYMEQVEIFVNGTTDYTQLVGGTGPLVYPAGHLYVYTVLYYLTGNGQNIFLGQTIFSGIYLLNLILIFAIYQKSEQVPPYVMIFICCASYRVHSIYMLRLFNDPIAVLILYGAILLMLNNMWLLGCICYSLAVSVKMNILLYAPALFFILVGNFGYIRTYACIGVCSIVQVLVALPFLLNNPIGYLRRSFEFDRQFFFKWTVNWRFLDEDLFKNRSFQATLLLLHLLVMFTFLFRYAFRPRRELSCILFTYDRDRSWKASTNDILFVMFTTNFIGIMFSRTLHYQFYVWYFHTLPYLLWQTSYSPVFRLSLLGVIELCWNTFPSTNWSSAALHVCHVLIFGGICHSWNKKRLPFTVEETADEAILEEKKRD